MNTSALHATEWGFMTTSGCGVGRLFLSVNDVVQLWELSGLAALDIKLKIPFNTSYPPLGAVVDSDYVCWFGEEI